MPQILAIDTSTDACSVAILTPSGISQILSITPREHTQRVLPAIEKLLSEHQLSLTQFDAIAFSVGPGSFTGLRIGISVAQGLAYGADLPLIPISTLAAMAQTAVRLLNVRESQTIMPVIDARMNEVYWSTYTLDKQTQKVCAISDELMAHPDKAINDSVAIESDIVAVGSGWIYEPLQQRFGVSATVDFYPHAQDIAILAEDDYNRGLMISPLEANPTYIRDEVSWKKRQRIRQ